MSMTVEPGALLGLVALGTIFASIFIGGLGMRYLDRVFERRHQRSTSR